MNPPAAAHVKLKDAHRGVPFTDVTAFRDFDYSAATFVMEVRRYRDASGAPLIALGNASEAAEGVSCTVETVEGVPTSYVQVRINETTLEGLPFTNPRGGDLELQYALDVTGGGHGKARRMYGRFTLKASANG